MKKGLSLLAVVLLLTGATTGCVKIIDAGTEGQYTGVKEFDASADSASNWGQIVDELTSNAKDCEEVLGSDGISEPMAISGTAEITEFESKANGKKNALILKVEGFEGTVKLQIGSIYSGTDVRDVQTLRGFGDFTNQTQWSEYGKALNEEIDTQVIAPLEIDESVVGKKATFVGAASESGGEVTITPVVLTIE